MIKLGVISDTHGMIHPKVLSHFEYVDFILHCGDIDAEEIIKELELIAPVYAVQGNMDKSFLVSRFPQKRILEFEDIHIMLIHAGLDGDTINPIVSESIREKKIDIICFGHTHQPYHQEKDGILYFNPGGGGRKRDSRPLGIGIIEINSGTYKARLIPLE